MKTLYFKDIEEFKVFINEANRLFGLPKPKENTWVFTRPQIDDDGQVFVRISRKSLDLLKGMKLKSTTKKPKGPKARNKRWR